jgi:hypothetical protein
MTTKCIADSIHNNMDVHEFGAGTVHSTRRKKFTQNQVDTILLMLFDLDKRSLTRIASTCSDLRTHQARSMKPSEQTAKQCNVYIPQLPTYCPTWETYLLFLEGYIRVMFANI